jgi:hypothetical protein
MLLDHVESALRHALVFGEALPHGLLDESGVVAEDRFDIHRNHFVKSLSAALEKTFPAVVSLVDRRFFAYCADEFVRSDPPHAPCLFEYGSAFPEFLAVFPPCRSLPYLPDVARLEWAIHAVFHAADPGAPGQGERGLPDDVRLMRSPFPVHRIWQAALDPNLPEVDVAGGEARLLIYRANEDAAMEQLGEAAFVFLEAVARRAGPLVALAEATGLDRNYSLGRGLPAQVMSRLFGKRTMEGDLQ